MYTHTHTQREREGERERTAVHANLIGRKGGGALCETFGV